MMLRSLARRGALVWLCAACVAVSASALAQEDNCRCEGTVVDDEGNPLAGAKISFYLKAKNLHAQPVKTNKKGKYSHNFLPVGVQQIKAELEGYKMVRITAETSRADGTRVTEDSYMVGSDQSVHDVNVVPQSRSDVTSKARCVLDFVMAPADRHGEAFRRLQAEKLAKEGKPVADAGATGDDAVPAPAAPAAPGAAPTAPGSPRSPLDQARELISQHDYAGAVAKAREAVEQDPAGAEAHRWLGDALLHSDDLAGAEQALRKALELDPMQSGANFDLGLLYVKKGRVVQAIPHFEKEHELNPDAPSVLENLAKVYSEAGQHEKAIGVYEKLLAIDPEKIEYYGDLADAYKQAGNTAKELEVYQRMGAKDPTGTAFYNLGNMMFNKSEMQKAADAYKKALQQSPDNAMAHYQLGLAYVNLGQFKEAASELETFAKLKPKDPKAAEARSLAADLRKMGG